jgi:hypothetical protein
MKKLLYIAIIIAILIPVAAFANGVKIGGNGYQCVATADNRWKVETGNTADLPDGYIIESVVVKHQDCIQVYPSNEADSCYEVNISDNSVTVTRIGDGNDCKEISHLEGTYVIDENNPPEYRVESTCSMWFVYKDNVLIDSGTWNNPNVDETFTHEESRLVIEEPQNCNVSTCEEQVIWVWLLRNPETLQYDCSIRDWGYDGTYFSPSTDSQLSCCKYISAEGVKGAWVTVCDTWIDNDGKDLDKIYTHNRYDVKLLQDLPCGTNCQ